MHILGHLSTKIIETATARKRHNYEITSYVIFGRLQFEFVFVLKCPKMCTFGLIRSRYPHPLEKIRVHPDVQNVPISKCAKGNCAIFPYPFPFSSSVMHSFDRLLGKSFKLWFFYFTNWCSIMIIYLDGQFSLFHRDQAYTHRWYIFDSAINKSAKPSTTRMANVVMMHAESANLAKHDFKIGQRIGSKLKLDWSFALSRSLLHKKARFVIFDKNYLCLWNSLNEWLDSTWNFQVSLQLEDSLSHCRWPSFFVVTLNW